MRMHFSVLVTGERFSQAVVALRGLGLTTAFVPFDTLIGAVRLGSSYDFAADVILIDGTTSNPLRSEGTLKAVNVVHALSVLSDMYVMPTGVRWNAAPQVVIGEDAGLEALLRQTVGRSTIDYLTPYDTFVWGETPEFWKRVYDRLKSRHLAFSPMLADSMRSLGVIFRELHGQLLRLSLRPGVRREELESEFYAGAHDRFFDARSRAMRRVLSVLAGAPEATARAVYELGRIALDPKGREALPEDLTQLHPYFFDIAQHEAIAQRAFRLSDHSTIRFDMLRRDTGIAGRPGAEIFEYKRGGHRQQQGLGLSQFEYLGGEQVDAYHAKLRADDALARRRLRSTFTKARKRVVGGYAAGADQKRLAQARNRFNGIVFEGWDEVADRNRARFGIPDGWKPDSVA